MADRFNTLDAVRAESPALAVFLERSVSFIVAYRGTRGIYAVYRPRTTPGLDALPGSPFMCTMLDTPTLIRLEEGMSWSDDLAETVAEALADGFIDATREAQGQLVVSEADAEEAVEEQSRISETLEHFKTRLTRIARLQQLNASNDILRKDIVGARVLWRIVALAGGFTRNVWPDALHPLVHELGFTLEAYSLRANPTDKLERIVEALEDLTILRGEGFHPSHAKTTEDYVQTTWQSIEDTREAQHHFWPAHVIDMARELGIDVRSKA